ncbi:hypothetical protein, partial [Kitasatospora sp. NPDC057198]|uniref:hypothetical protein n=1 Tax=Kitasatospora sp. NPDC057198 TaxID=3346046 RepID=UPI003643FC06
TAPLAALLTGVLALVLVFLAAALPRALDRGADRALRALLDGYGPVATSVVVTAGPQADGGDPARQLDATAARLTGLVSPQLPLDASGPVYGRRGTEPRSLPAPGLDRPEGVSPEVALVYQHGARERLHLTAGQWPDGEPDGGTSGGTDGGTVPVALAASTAATLKVELGAVLDGGLSVLSPVTRLKPQRIRVVGLYAVDDPADPFWADLRCAVGVCRNLAPPPGPGAPPLAYWYAVALTGEKSVPRLSTWGTGAEDFWRLPVRTGALRADLMADTSSALAAVTTGPVAVRITTGLERPNVRVTSGLRTAIDTARQRQAAIDSITAVGPAGAAGVAAVVLCLAAALGVERRSAELRLLRARGAGTGGVLRRLLGEGALTVLPGAVLGWAAAFLLLPTPRWVPAALAAGAVALLALLAFPVRAALLLRGRAGRARPGRRLLAEGAVLVVTAAAVAQLVRRGVAPLGEGVDPLLVAAPLLLSLSGALLLARVQPVLIGWWARRAGRWPGAVGFLGLARAARGGGGRRARPSVLPLLALVLAVACGAVGADVLGSVDSDRLRVARYGLGGDAWVTAGLNGALPPSFLEAADRLPGVETSLPVWIDDDVVMSVGGGASVRVNVVAADPVRYARLAEVAGRGRFDPALLAGAADGGRLPALVSGDLPAGDFSLRLAGG